MIADRLYHYQNEKRSVSTVWSPRWTCEGLLALPYYH